MLSADVVTRGTVRFGLPQPVSLAPSPLKAAPGWSRRCPYGTLSCNEGDVVLTASGRPVFVLQGQVPAYRDLTPGLTGADVDQLKQALDRMGFEPGSTAEPMTSRPALPSPDGTRPRAGSRSVQRGSSSPPSARWSASGAMRLRPRPPPPPRWRPAGVSVEAARAAAAHTVKAAAVENAARLAGGQRRPGDPQQGGAALAVESERARAQFASSAADADLAAQIAEQALVALDPRQTETARNVANAKLEVARAARQKARLEGELAVQAAEREASLSADRAGVARAAERSARLEGDRAVRSALDAQKLAALELKMASERADQSLPTLLPQSAGSASRCRWTKWCSSGRFLSAWRRSRPPSAARPRDRC